ncbi:hypothetical protein WMY93_027728 [Mugilogobius chulae]|uniref:C-type lectin domain-containing protein n=1 Tax=Mugilogobius chulae TaxID=88201 RepID=A0AAW0N4V0_9GOBI
MNTMQLSVVSLLLLGVSLSLASPNASPVTLVQGSCPMYWFSFNNRCYKYVALLRPGLMQRSSVVKNELDWISDVHKEGAWMWSDGYPLTFSQWSVGQPDNWEGNENCAVTFWVRLLFHPSLLVLRRQLDLYKESSELKQLNSGDTSQSGPGEIWSITVRSSQPGELWRHVTVRSR